MKHVYKRYFKIEWRWFHATAYHWRQPLNGYPRFVFSVKVWRFKIQFSID